jgi:hypothetical protein
MKYDEGAPMKRGAVTIALMAQAPISLVHLHHISYDALLEKYQLFYFLLIT